jgi:hypothetical protein
MRTVILARAPVAGACKTRLIPVLGAAGAAALAQRMLLHTLDAALAAGIGPVTLCTTPDPDDPVWHTLPLPPGIALAGQGPGDLGERLARAAQASLCSGTEGVLLIGTDCPALDAALLRTAAAALSAHDAVLLPVSDGGYALLGLRRFDTSLFEGIAWSTPMVAEQTLARLDALGWSVARLPIAHDIDTPADLRHLPHDWTLTAHA